MVELTPGTLVAATAPGNEGRDAVVVGFAVIVDFLTGAAVPLVRDGVADVVALGFAGMDERVVADSFDCFVVDDVDAWATAGCSEGKF